MTTRRELLGRARTAVETELNRQGVALANQAAIDDVTYAAIEAVINAIGDHTLAQMIGDTGQRERPPIQVVTEQTDDVEVLQSEDDDA